ncbi:hypothetical protein BDF14DRAFT_908004 [Spinellus fusiger]|nr:hypothetical protein BDF14DRAFT_908004 [Spinellus fusiger]
MVGFSLVKVWVFIHVSWYFIASGDMAHIVDGSCSRFLRNNIMISTTDISYEPNLLFNKHDTEGLHTKKNTRYSNCCYIFFFIFYFLVCKNLYIY